MTLNLSMGTRRAAFSLQAAPRTSALSQSCMKARQNISTPHLFHRCHSSCPCRARVLSTAALGSNGSSAVISKDIEVPVRDYEQAYLASRYFRAYIIQIITFTLGLYKTCSAKTWKYLLLGSYCRVLSRQRCSTWWYPTTPLGKVWIMLLQDRHSQ